MNSNPSSLCSFVYLDDYVQVVVSLKLEISHCFCLCVVLLGQPPFGLPPIGLAPIGLPPFGDPGEEGEWDDKGHFLAEQGEEDLLQRSLPQVKNICTWFSALLTT